MLRILSIVIGLSLLFSNGAIAADVVFDTLEKAQMYCPANNALRFIAVDPYLPNSKGVITGTNRINFESYVAANNPPKFVIQPKKMDSSGLILDSQFRNVDGIYGYISGNIVTCLYTYTSIADVQAVLGMRGK